MDQLELTVQVKVPEPATPMLPRYVQDAEPDKDGKFWWHAVASRRRQAGYPAIFSTGCMQELEDPVRSSISEEMTRAKWEERFGDDFDLCMCAVDSPEDLEWMAGVVAGAFNDAN